jgi:hypothetical protein
MDCLIELLAPAISVRPATVFSVVAKTLPAALDCLLSLGVNRWLQCVHEWLEIFTEGHY